MSNEALEKLMARLAGECRELKNIVERLVIMSPGRVSTWRISPRSRRRRTAIGGDRRHSIPSDRTPPGGRQDFESSSS